MKLWDKGTGEVSKQIDDYTVGLDRTLDLLLAKHDVLGSMAHTAMLQSIGLLKISELKQIHAELQIIYDSAARGEFVIEEGMEDVHSQVEVLLTRKLGDIGKMIHSGRSRNDQVLVDLRLFVRDEIKAIVELIDELFKVLNALSIKYKDLLLPGYTHFQVAMPSSFGLWFGAYAESLIDDLHLFKAAFDIVNQNPLGSGAGYGSSFPLDRTMTTELLGFSDLNYNVLYAQMSRGKMEKSVAFAMSSVAATLSRLSMDVCVYNSQNFGFIKLPNEMTTGSSIMPHKKNPDVFELIRAKMNKLQALPSEISMIMSNLPSGYHRDMQTIKEAFLPAFKELKSTLEITVFAMNQIEVNSSIMDDPKYQDAFTVEKVNELVLNGMPFRDAYVEIGKAVERGDSFVGDLNHTHLGSIGNPANAEIEVKFNRIRSQFNFKYEDQLKQLLIVQYG